MFSLFKQALKVAVDYFIFLIVYIGFLPFVIVLAGEKFTNWMPLYSLLIGLFLSVVLWMDVYENARKENKAIYDLHPSPHKGFIIGAVGFAPFVVLTVGVFIFLGTVGKDIQLTTQMNETVKVAFLTPVFFIISLLGKNIAAYIASMFYVPLLCYFAYMAGNKGITRKGISNAVKKMIKGTRGNDR